jgi:hypothetical protein
MCLVSCVLIFALTVFALRHTCHSKACYNVPKQGELSHYRYLALSCKTDDEVLNPSVQETFLHSVQTGSGVHKASYSFGKGALFS